MRHNPRNLTGGARTSESVPALPGGGVVSSSYSHVLPLAPKEVHLFLVVELDLFFRGGTRHRGVFRKGRGWRRAGATER